MDNVYERILSVFHEALNIIIFVFNVTFLWLYLFRCTGKSGHVAARLAGTLSSVGIAAHYVSATEWAHGDLGRTIDRTDVHGVSNDQSCKQAYIQIKRLLS